MALEIGSSVSGEVTAVVAEGFLIALPEGRVGLVGLASLASASRDSQSLRVGERLTVRILAAGAEGRFELCILPSEERPADAFDREFHRLKSVLKSRSSRLVSSRGARERLPEEDVEKWLAQAEMGLARLHEHRAQRLAEAFYDEEEEGGAHGKRDSSN
jgi:predicted RNA-binding protein with RPS1 domain